MVIPLREKLAVVTKQYNEAMANLKEQQEKLDKIQSEIASKKALLDENNAKKEQYQNDINMCTVKLDRAGRLLGGLGGESDRWEGIVQEMNVYYE